MWQIIPQTLKILNVLLLFVRPVYVCCLSLKSLAERRKLFSGAASFTSLYAIMLI